MEFVNFENKQAFEKYFLEAANNGRNLFIFNYVDNRVIRVILRNYQGQNLTGNDFIDCGVQVTYPSGRSLYHSLGEALDVLYNFLMYRSIANWKLTQE